MYYRTWWTTPPEQWGWWHCCTQYRQAKFYCRDEPPWVTDLTSWHQPQKEFSLWIEASKKCLKGPLTICTRSKPLQNIKPTTESQKFCWYVNRLVVYFCDSYLYKCYMLSAQNGHVMIFLFMPVILCDISPNKMNTFLWTAVFEATLNLYLILHILLVIHGTLNYRCRIPWKSKIRTCHIFDD